MSPEDATPRRPTLRVTPTQVKELRTLKLALIHPDDNDRLQLMQQISRIGCQVQPIWPPVPALPEGIDIALVAVRPDSLKFSFEWAQAEDSPAVIAVVTYENPTILEAVLQLGAKAVLPSPVRSFGLMSALVVARETHKECRMLARRLRKVEAKLLGARRIAEAKNILMKTHDVTETQAYDLIREQAMKKRTTTEEIALAIIIASETLSIGFKPHAA